ncbi:acetyl-CoA carboxylase biotin carboxyl carrier protein [Saccharothrix australiensis]|uniref:Biotin-dependent enzyme n=1 Tax=Saccharothrix australiensis TaxID=2072 RepID=A0A495VZ64_9PSEU|nr:acetyl-CoA carboxylase biotin carboxyl carrier protein subunit [Saccharothrix australiensis]RKT54514.1 biotin-dependent enzyme [Saccharothrix australiensis]
MSTHVSPIPPPHRGTGPADGVPLDVVRQLLAAVHRHSARRLVVRTAGLEVEIEADHVRVEPGATRAGTAPTDTAPAADTAPALVDVVATAVGVVRFTTGPGSPSGLVVAADDQVAQIEAMKTVTAVLAGHAGVVREVCARDGDVVSFGQPLLRLEPVGDDGAPADALG